MSVTHTSERAVKDVPSVSQPISAGSAVEVSQPIPSGPLTEPGSMIQLADNIGPPKFTMPLYNKTVKSGESVWFHSRFEASPHPDVVWCFNGKPIQEDGDFQVIVDFSKGESTLVIREAFPDDEGEYMCKLVNAIGTALTTSHLFVICKYLFVLFSSTCFAW